MLKLVLNVGQYGLFGIAIYMFVDGTFPDYAPFILIAFSDICSLKVSVIELKEELAKIKNKVN